MSRVTNSHVSPIPLYDHCLSEHCLWVNIVPVKTLCPLRALVIQVPRYKICLFNRHCQFRRSQVSTNDRHGSNIWYINMPNTAHNDPWVVLSKDLRWTRQILSLSTVASVLSQFSSKCLSWGYRLRAVSILLEVCEREGYVGKWAAKPRASSCAGELFACTRSQIFEQKIDCLQSTEAKENFSIILL